MNVIPCRKNNALRDKTESFSEVIELKGCLDGNNTAIFERPPHAMNSLYLLPNTIPSPRNHPEPQPQSITDVEILNAFFKCFKANDDELYQVRFNVWHHGVDTERKTIISRNGVIVKESEYTAIRRS